MPHDYAIPARRHTLTAPDTFLSDMSRSGVRPNLAELIERMSQFDRGPESTVSISFNAHREAEGLDDVTMARELDSYLRDNPNGDPGRRRAAYFVIGKIGKNCSSPECATLLIGHIGTEKDTFTLGCLLIALAEVPKPAQVDLGPVFSLFHSKKLLIRRRAIGSLVKAASAEVESRVLDVLRAASHPSDVVACHATLNRIGTAEALPALEAGLESRQRDVKVSAQMAIEAIRKRIG